MAKIFISPSTQDWNQYAGGGTGLTDSEEYWCRKASAACAARLRAKGHEVKVGGTVSWSANVKMGNDWGAQWYIAIHTNAGGGEGTEVWYYTGSSKGKSLAQGIYGVLAPLTDEPDRGVKDSTKYGELNGPHCPSVIVEILFHDDRSEAAEMRRDYDVFGVAIADGAMKVIPAVAKPPVTPPKPPTPPTPPKPPVPKAPPWPGRVLRYKLPRMKGTDVKRWQAQMKERGYNISVDGVYGKESRAVCKRFQEKHDLTVDGKVGPTTWRHTFIG